MPPQREKIFNVPGVVLAAVVLLFGIHAVRTFLPLTRNLDILANFAFVPGRFTYALDPRPVVAGLNALAQKSPLDAYVASHYFLGNGKLLWWTPITYAFLHASYLHVGFNCLWLVAFGAPVARRFGTPRFLLFCLVTAIAGALAHYLTHIDDLEPVIGASAVVSGTMAAAVRFVFQPGAPLGGALGYLEPVASDHAYRQPAWPLYRVFTDRRALAFLFAFFVANLLFGLAPQLVGMPGVTIAWQAHFGGFLVGLVGFPLFDPPAPPQENTKFEL